MMTAWFIPQNSLTSAALQGIHPWLLFCGGFKPDIPRGSAFFDSLVAFSWELVLQSWSCVSLQNIGRVIISDVSSFQTVIRKLFGAYTYCYRLSLIRQSAILAALICTGTRNGAQSVPSNGNILHQGPCPNFITEATKLQSFQSTLQSSN
jgi:hypothetical protein